MTHNKFSKRQLKGQARLDTMFTRINAKENAYYRRCENCNRKNAICKYPDGVGGFYRMCRYCEYIPPRPID